MGGDPCIVEISECSKRGLTETDSAVVRGHNVVGPDGKPVRLKKRSYIFKQQFVLEDASREHNCIDSVAIAKPQNNLN